MIDTSRHQDPATLWVPRRQLSLDEARRRTAIVKVIRVLFAAGAAISVGFLVGYIINNALNSRVRPVSINDDEVITMVNPRFTGRDAEGLAYVLTAEAARRRPMGDTAIDLVNPVLKDASGSVVKAPAGVYDRSGGVLELSGLVEILDAESNSFKSDGARVLVDEARIIGLSPLEGSGPMGDIRSDSYEVLDGGDRVIFRDNVHMVINPPSDDDAETETIEETADEMP